MRVLQWVLAATLIAAVAAGVRQWSRESPGAGAPVPPSSQSAGETGAPGPAPRAEPSAPPRVAPETSPPRASGEPAAGIALVGIFAGATPESSSGLFETRDGSRSVVRVGDALPGGELRLLELRPASALLEDGSGERIELALRGGQAERDAGSGLFSKTPEELDRLFDEPVERRLMVSLDRALVELEGALQLETDAAGGARIQNLDPGNPLARLGLRPGDRVLRVDGIDIGSAPQGMVALATTLYSEGGNTLLTVQRFDGSQVQIATGSGLALTRPDSSPERDPISR